jgi:hypothetical protein
MLFFIAAAVTLLSPIQRPWYFIWALPFCCIRVRWSWLLLTVLSLLTYIVVVDYNDLYWSKFIIYMTFYIAALVEFYLNRRAAASVKKTAPTA